MNVAINAQEGPLLNATYMIRFFSKSNYIFSRRIRKEKNSKDMIFLPLTTAASSATKFVYKDIMTNNAPWYSAAVYKGIWRGIVSLIALAVVLQFADMHADATTHGMLFLTQIIYVGISFYHMYLLATTPSPTVLGAVISCLLLITSLIIGALFFQERLTGTQIIGVILAIIAILFMTTA